jgi:hypothetical protein
LTVNLALAQSSIFVLPYFLDATVAQVKTPLALGLMAVFARFPFFRDARLSSFSLKPACFTERLTALFNRPPHGLAPTYFSAFASVSIRLRGGVVGFVHFVHPPK